jgi:hypothetical protein
MTRINGTKTLAEMSDLVISLVEERKQLEAKIATLQLEANRMRCILKHIQIHGGTSRLWGGDIPEYVRRQMLRELHG